MAEIVRGAASCTSNSCDRDKSDARRYARAASSRQAAHEKRTTIVLVAAWTGPAEGPSGRRTRHSRTLTMCGQSLAKSSACNIRSAVWSDISAEGDSPPKRTSYSSRCAGSVDDPEAASSTPRPGPASERASRRSERDAIWWP
ncbi:hypothetical protein TKK_0013883 [Trichogramma kaykai]